MCESHTARTSAIGRVFTEVFAGGRPDLPSNCTTVGIPPRCVDERPDPWSAWIDQKDAIQWLAWYPNASLVGLAARLQTGRLTYVSLADLSWWWLLPIASAGGWLVYRALRTIGAPRWSMALLAATLLSPLGWIYYLPIGLAWLRSSWPSNRVAALALVLLCVPFHWLRLVSVGWAAAVIAGSIYCWAVVLLYLSFSRRARVQST